MVFSYIIICQLGSKTHT